MKESAVPERIVELAEKWINGTITPREKEEFSNWYNRFNDESVMVHTDPAVLGPDMLKEILQRVKEDKQPERPGIKKNRVRTLARYAAAAILILLLGTGGYMLVFKNKPAPPVPIANGAPEPHDIRPGGNRAILTLANGSVVSLDSTSTGDIARQGNSSILKINGNRLIYHATANSADAIPCYNTLTTPRGGKYELELPDGSKAWLNAASSITYPVTFTGNRRALKMTGEVYFEVAPDPGKPFVVATGNNVQVEVLGTHFNMNAYPDEQAINTTLLEGKVRIVRPGAAAVIKPGQQASAGSGDGVTVADDVDLALVMAWKNGFFQFHNADLRTVLRQVSRWYDVDIRYEGNIPSREFEGKIQQNLTLRQVLKILQKNQAHLALEERTIIVKE